MRKIKFAKGKIYHIFNRGVEKRDIFLSDRDRWRFLQGLFIFNDERTSGNLLFRIEQENKRINFTLLKEFVAEQRAERKPLVKILADCLMPNHYHLLVEEIRDGGISKFMQKFGTGYTKYFNKKYDRVGSLFQGRFKAKVVDEDLYLQYLLVYINVVNPGQLIEPNLKEEGIHDIDAVIGFAEKYLWSTNQEYLQIRESIIIEKGVLGEFFPNGDTYKAFVRDILRSKKFVTISHLLFD